MGARDYWDRMLVYFGITDEPDHGDDTRAASRRSGDPDDDWSDDAPRTSASRSGTGRPARSRPAGGSGSAAGVGVVPPRTFNDAQKIADQFKRGLPVIVNLQQTDSELSKRLIDFASGLTYGLDGAMSRIADRVFLLTPPDVEVSAEERAAMAESGFFNQS